MPNINIKNLQNIVLANGSTPKVFEDPAKTIGRLTEYSANSLVHLSQRHFTSRRENTGVDDINLTNLITYLQPVHEHSVQVIQDAERVRELAPEIPQAENIVVSSIMSPNDLQDTDPKFSIENMPHLNETVKTKICDYLSQFFNPTLKLNEKMTRSAKEALYRAGADVFLILPEDTLARLVKKYNTNVGKENLSALYYQIYTEEHYKELLDEPIFSGKKKTSVIKVGKEQKTIPAIPIKKQSVTSSVKADEEYKLDKKYKENGFLEGLESYLMKELASENYKIEEIRNGLETITAKIITQFEEGDTLKISENPEVLRFGKAVRHYGKTMLGRRFEELYEDAEKTTNDPDKYEPIIDLTPYTGVLDDQKGHPYCINIPAEAVIPVVIPGTRSEHLGYFILVDSLGHPIQANQYVIGNNGCSISNRITAAYTAMFGTKKTQMTGIRSPYEFNAAGYANPQSFQKNAITKVFNYVLDEMLRRKLQDVGLRHVSVDKYETIATCMFYRLLENKQTSLVFVPENLITYIAFDYRDNGTGKSKLEDINFVLSLRVTLLVANMMALMKNAVARKEIEVSVDPKETNIMGLIDQIKQAVLTKYSLNLSTNVQETAMNILNQNISVRTLPHPNAQGMDIKSNDVQSQVPKADTELNDTISTWLTSLLDVPYAAMNQTNEYEYSRSVATTNLFFGKKIRNFQKILCQKYSELVQTYLRYSPELVGGIRKILSGQVSGEEKDHAVNEVPLDNTSVTKDHSTLTKEQIQEYLVNVIKNITISLPAPNIAPDKAQFEIFQEFMTTLTTAIDNIYTDDLAGDDSDATNGLRILKANIKSNIAKDFANQMGIDTTITSIDDLTNYILTNRSTLVSNLQSLKGLGTRVRTQMSVFSEDTPTEDEGTTVSNKTDESSDFGDSFGENTESNDSGGSMDDFF